MVAPAGEQHQLLPRKWLPRVLDEHLDQRELAGREVDGLAVAGERARREVELERAECRAAATAGRAGRQPLAVAAQHGVDARDELARIERLRQVVVGPHLEPDDAVDVLAPGREHDDRYRLAGRAQPPADGQAVLAGQHQVEDEEMRGVPLELAVEVARVRQRDHLEPLLAEVARQEVPQAGVVVDDQDARQRRSCWSWPIRRRARGAGDGEGVTDCNARRVT